MSNFKKQFKLLRAITPDASRKESFRHILQSKVVFEATTMPAQSIFTYMRRTIRTVPALVFALIITLIGSGSGISYAAQNAIPGESLYGIKLATEQARIVITPNKQTKAELHLSFASRRLDELEQLIEQNGSPHVAVSETLTRYEHELNESEALAINDPLLAQAISLIIGETTESHKQTLRRVSEKAHARLIDGDFDDEFNDAYEHAESKDDAVLYAALTATSTPSATIPLVIREKSRKKWESIEDDMKKIEGAHSAPGTAENNTTTIATGTTAALTTAHASINEAKTNWENGEYAEALKYSIEAREHVKKAGKIEKERKKEEDREKSKQRDERTQKEDEDEKDD
ncbi:MAG: DUF5667 domain-containing protein [Candidatus Azambacteria bacterium]|nr:DUF5667 domain-containing protein [Candidatus Azambacteria bacterium]